MTLALELQVSMGPSPHLWSCACKTAWLATELLVSMGPSPHLWFLHEKQLLLDQNYKSLWVLDFPADLWMQNSVIKWRLTFVYWSQPSSVVLCFQNSDFRTRITSLHGTQTTPVVLCKQNNVISIGNTSLYGSQPSTVVFECKTATLGPELQVSMDLRPHL